MKKCNFPLNYTAMRRLLINELEVWKSNSARKPLIIQGARQVGKTWAMKEFGAKNFEQLVYINFESSVRLRNMFQEDFDIARIIAVFEIETGMKIQPDSTLIVLDEIQEAEKGLTVLKYFYENAPEYYVIAAGSLLGVSIQKNKTFPVGKVDFMTLYPMSFEEFLLNLGESRLVEAIKLGEWQIVGPFHEKLIQYLRTYYFTGGMPEAVKVYIESKNLESVREVQKSILTGYENDFAKYAPNNSIPKIRLVWQSILSQLARENKKFIYGQLKKGGRAKEFEEAISWLTNAGLLLKCHLISKPVVPLKAYIDYDVFKLYLLDIGLLNAMADLPQQMLLNQNQVLIEFKGALTEQFVAQELVNSHDIYYWSAENATAEVDFLIQKEGNILPIEVKAEENLKAKSLSVFEEKFKTGNAVRISMSPYRTQNWMVNRPLYGVFVI